MKINTKKMLKNEKTGGVRHGCHTVFGKSGHNHNNIKRIRGETSEDRMGH